MGRNPIDLTGQTFGTLRPLRRLDRKAKDQTSYLWLCLCDPELGGCGREVERTNSWLRRVKSCGCGENGSHEARRKTERNAEIYERWQGINGPRESAGVLADEHLISMQRVLQIVAGEAARRGEERRTPWDTEVDNYGCSHKEVPAELMDLVRAGLASTATVAEHVGICRMTVLRRMLDDGEGAGQARSRRAAEINAEVYRRFMAGATQGQLADELDTNVGCVQQRILRHRRATGDPAKCPHLKGNKNGATP